MSDPQDALASSPAQGPPGAPVYLDPDYPALLRDLAEQMAKKLCEIGIDPARATLAAEAIGEHVRETYGGQMLNWPKGAKFNQRTLRERMWTDFTGDNHMQLAARYGLSWQWIYKELKRAKSEFRQRSQPDLF